MPRRLLRRLFPGRSKRSTTTLELSDLSDWDLLCLTDVLPLEDLLRLGCVSHRFNQLARRRQPGRRHLLLFIGPKLAGLSSIQNVITVPALSFTLVDRILLKLPSIVNLWVYNRSSASENLEPIIYLLGCLSAQLRKLYITFTKEFHPPTSQQPLFAAINRLAKLTSLDLDYRGDSELFTTDEPAIIELPIISQLADFTFSLYNITSTETVLLELIQRATASKPTKISFGAYFDVRSLNLLRNISPGLAAHFTSLKPYSYFFNLAHLANICDKFTQLTTLEFSLNRLSIRQVFTNLVKLSRLSKLSLTIHFPNRIYWRQNPRMVLARFGEAAEPDDIGNSDLVALPTVNELELQLWLTNHDDLASLHLATVFPNVTTLNLILIECVQCGYNRKKKNDIIHKRRCLMKLTKLLAGAAQAS